MGLEEEYTEFLGNKVVCHSLPIRPGRNLAVIVEICGCQPPSEEDGLQRGAESCTTVYRKAMTRKKKGYRRMIEYERILFW